MALFAGRVARRRNDQGVRTAEDGKSLLARIFHPFGGPLINAAALARRTDALSLQGTVFQQFVSRDGKLLKTAEEPKFRACTGLKRS